MGFDSFPVSRDFLYLGAALGGLCLACVVVLVRVRGSKKTRNRIITLGLCLLSAAIAALMPALIRSGGKVFLVKPLLLAAAAGALLFALAGSFPRAFGFPLVLAGGLVVVWLGLAFLRFPPLEDEGRLVTSVYNAGDGSFVLKPPEPPDSGQNSITIDDTGSPLEFTAAVVEFDPLLPVIGGLRRGIVTEILRDGKPLFTEPRWENPLTGSLYRLIQTKTPWACVSVREYHAQCGMDAILPGMSRGVYVNQSGLEVRAGSPRK
ncbi:MAG: hypothetical protein LBQ38_06630 [Spirochaetaceae bacterium]|jgi:hypothetical protein|nr:hypothetical protein [Spirochaetaceae bacterium]